MVDPLAEIRVKNPRFFDQKIKILLDMCFFLAIDNAASVKSMKVSYLLGRKNGSKISVDSLLC